jgi:hypothetical protein
MKHLFTLLLVVAFFGACNNEKCTLVLSKDWNESVMPNWDTETYNNVVHEKKDSLISIFAMYAEANISMFERELFFKTISKLPNLKTYTFDSLIVVEINGSGERLTMSKYLVPYCVDGGSIIEFRLNQGKWQLIRAHKIEANKFRKSINDIMAKNNDKSYWRAGINDFIVISKFASHNRTSVEVSEHLSEKQYNALSILDR